MAELRIGTSSWKYDSWEGLVYTAGSSRSYLEQYAEEYDTVEIDQWFWSLFEAPEPRLPELSTAEEYRRSVPPNFRFTVKVPNSITLTHHYQKNKQQPLKPNPHFLSPELFGSFLRRIEPIRDLLGALIFQFEYLNRQKMPAQAQFHGRLEGFFQKLERPAPCVIEVRNPNYLNASYFEFLASNRLGHCFLQGYYMPDITKVYAQWGSRLEKPGPVVVRLHGPDRQGMERKTAGTWDRTVEARDEEIARIMGMVDELWRRDVDIYLNVNNHYEGSAPLTIEKLRRFMR